MKYFYSYEDDIFNHDGEIAILIKSYFTFSIRYLKNGVDHKEDGPSYIEMAMRPDGTYYYVFKSWFLNGKILFNSYYLNEFKLNEPKTLNDIKKIALLI